MADPKTPLQATLDHVRSVAQLGASEFSDERFPQIVELLTEQQEETYPVYKLTLPEGYYYRNVRAEPGGEVVGQLHTGDQVEIIVEQVYDGLEYGQIRLFWDAEDPTNETNQFDGSWVYMGSFSLVSEGTSTHTRGIDISHWNTVNSFLKVWKAGYRFVFSKATQGTWMQDDTHHDYMSRAEDAGFFYAPYHFLDPGDGVAQAEYFYNFANPGNMRPMMDWEKVDIDLLDVLAFLAKTEELFGKKPIIYSSYRIINEYVRTHGEIEWLNDYPFWVASYTTADSPTMPPGVYDWAIWQHSRKGTPDGTEGNIDLNRFNGSLTELKEFA